MRATRSILRSSLCAATVATLLFAGGASAQQQTARFNMIQNGKRMTADDFDKWMKAQGYQSSGQPAATASEPEKKLAKAAPAKKAVAKKKLAAATPAKKPAALFADVTAKVSHSPSAM